MSEAAPQLERLLRQALIPVEPPEDLPQRLERTLRSLTEIAAGELDALELRAMRDPRNWVRPAAALLVGTSAGTALVVLRVRRRHANTPPPPDGLRLVRDAAGRALLGAGGDARRRLLRRD